MSANASEWESTLAFRGGVISVLQQKRARDTAEEEDNTGWQVWECSNAALRYAAENDETALSLAARDDSGGRPGPWLHPSPASAADLRWLDMSAGAGIIVVALQSIGATVAASETDSQLPQLRLNLDRTAAKLGREPCPALRYYWGDPVEALRPPWVPEGSPGPWYDVCIASDLVFISMGLGRPDRPQFKMELSLTLRRLTRVCTSVVFAFEERLIREEDEFMEELALALPDPPCPEDGPALLVREVKGQACVLAKEDRLKGVAGQFWDNDTDTADVFWEPPPVRIFVLKKA